MAFTYDLENNPAVAYVRLLIADTVEATAVFSDEEIVAAGRIQQSVFQSSMLYSSRSSGRATLPSSPISYLRIAALLLDALAANKARLSSLTKLLDVSLSPSAAAASLREQAQQYRTVDDESGAFVIIEQCSTSWSFADRFYKTIQRQTAAI